MIKFDKRNYRIHDERNKELIRKSLDECGAGRSILIDNEDEIIAGNGVYEQAQELGIPVKIIESDGNELVVVKRTDLKTDDEKRKKLAVMDNSTSDSSRFDIELLSADFEVEELKEIGFEENELKINSVLEELEDGAFLKKFKEESDVFCVTFSFPKQKESDFLQKMQNVGKEKVANHIMLFLGVNDA